MMNDSQIEEYNRSINESQIRHEDRNPQDFPEIDWEYESNRDDQGHHMLWVI